jgi:hypothetical protein
MKRLAILFVVTILLANLLTPASRSAFDTPRFVSLEGRFSISLPERFKQQTRLIVPTPSGDAFGKLYEWQTKGKTTFSIGYADPMKPIDGPETVKQFFDGVTARFQVFAVSVNGNMSSVKDIKLDNHPGIEQRADINKGAFIQRTYLVSQRIYQTITVMTNSERDESAAVSVLDSFKLLNDAEITEEALRTAPGPLPQTPAAPRAGSDASDEGLRGPVKSVRIEHQLLSKTLRGPRSWLTTYNEKGNMVRSESYDLKNNLVLITVYGYLDGSRVSASKFIPREDGIGIGTMGPVSNKKRDPRYDQRFEFKYDEKKRLIEQTHFSSNGDISWRRVFKYGGNQKEELFYPDNRTLTQRNLEILDDKGNVIERTVFAPDGTIRSKVSYTYEFDSNGNWTSQTRSWSLQDERLRKLEPTAVLRTITYY